jgi:acyl-CoA oxidase
MSESAPLPWPRNDPELLPFLPMVYVAWADGVLSREEMVSISDGFQGAGDLPEDSSRILESWLEPASPPSAAQLAQLRERIREAAARIPAGEARSLARLGIAMARVHGDGPGRWGTEGGLRTLEGVEELLGVLGAEAARALLEDEGEPEPAIEKARPGWEAPLRTLLRGDHAEVREKVLELLADPEVRVPDHLPTSEHRERVLAAIQRLANEELGGLGFPEEYGGTGDLSAAIAVFETLALGNLSVLVKYGVQFGLFGGSIFQLGTKHHHDRYLRDVASLELPGIFAMTERERGSNVRELQTAARYLPESDEIEVHTPHPGAVKDWLGNAALHGRMATVFAQLHVGDEEHGVHAVLVPVRDEKGRPLPGIGIEDCGEKVGLHGVDNGRLSFDRIRVPRENLLDRFGRITPEGGYESPIASPGRRFFTMLGTLVAGRVSIAAASVSAAKSGLAVAIRYSAERRQFGPAGRPQVPILDYLTQQRALFPALAGAYALHFGVRDLVRDYALSMDDEEARHRVEVLAAGFKALASRHCMDTLQACREAMGGRGYLAANRIGYLREDTDVFTTFEGANPVLLLLVARGLLSRYRDELGDLRLWGAVKFLADRAGTEATRRNPVRSRRTGEDHLRSHETQLEAFRFREQRLLETAARRLKARIDDGVDSFDAMNETQDHLLALARAHMERVILERFREAVARAGEGESAEAAEPLELLADLWALSRLEEDRAWFLESGYMEPRQTRAIREQVNRLCGELRPWAVPLVDAFGIPDEVLAAPAAFHETEGPEAAEP